MEGSTDTLRSVDIQRWGKMRRWFRYSHERSSEYAYYCYYYDRHRFLLDRGEPGLRLNQGDGGQSVVIDAGLRPYEVAALAAMVNAHLEGLDSE